MHVAEQEREGQWGSVEKDPQESWILQRAVPVLGMPSAAWEILGKLPDFSVPAFLHLHRTSVPHITCDLAHPGVSWGQSGVLDLPSAPTTTGGSDLGALTAQLGLDQGQLWRCAGCWWPEVVCSNTGANGCSCEVDAA